MPAKPPVSRAFRGACCVRTDMVPRPYRARAAKGTGTRATVRAAMSRRVRRYFDLAPSQSCCFPLRASGKVLVVVGAERRRSDRCCGARAKGRIERERERRHSGALGICEHVAEHTARRVVRIGKCIGEARNDRAATILAGETRTPD